MPPTSRGAWPGLVQVSASCTRSHCWSPLCCMGLSLLNAPCQSRRLSTWPNRWKVDCIRGASENDEPGSHLYPLQEELFSVSALLAVPRCRQLLEWQSVRCLECQPLGCFLRFHLVAHFGFDLMACALLMCIGMAQVYCQECLLKVPLTRDSIEKGWRAEAWRVRTKLLAEEKWSQSIFILGLALQRLRYLEKRLLFPWSL